MFARIILKINYCVIAITTLSRGIGMSFFDTEEAHAVMLACAAAKAIIDLENSVALAVKDVRRKSLLS